MSGPMIVIHGDDPAAPLAAAMADIEASISRGADPERAALIISQVRCLTFDQQEDLVVLVATTEDGE